MKVADWVEAVASPGGEGIVKRVAKDGSWADVDWGPRRKRMPTASLRVLTTIQRGHWEITDITRQEELEAGESR